MIYAGQDKDVLQNLILHLQSVLEGFNVIIWSDDAVDERQRWKPQNVSRLGQADVLLVLLSKTLLNSEFIKQDEFKMVIDRYKESKSAVIPIHLDDSSWDVDFTFDEYKFNFRELKVFRRDLKSFGDWNSTDKVFTQVAYYIMGLFAVSAQRNTLEIAASADEKRLLELEREGQMAIDFQAEKQVDDRAERKINYETAVEANKSVEVGNKLGEEAEIKAPIRKEKRFRQKAENQKRIEIEVTAKRVVQEEIRENDVVNATIEIDEKGRGEILNPLRETEREKRMVDIVAGHRRVAKKNGLARYNYRFDDKKIVDTLKVVEVERRVDAESKIQIAVEEKRRGEIANLLKETQRENRLRELVTTKKKVIKKDLSRYNYQFEKKIDAKANSSVQKEKLGDKIAKNQIAVKDRIRAKITKYLQETEWDSRRDKTIEALKGVKKKSLVKYNYLLNVLLKTRESSLVEEGTSDIEEPKRERVVKEKKYVSFVKNLQGTKWDEIVVVSKDYIKKYYVVIRNSQSKNFVAINRFFTKINENLSKNKKIGVRPEFLIAVVAIFGILTFLFTRDSETPSTTVSQIEEVGVDSDADVVTSVTEENQAGAIVELSVGDLYKGGIIFTIDASNEVGKIVDIDDKGPMTWKEAMAIHEQLGEGWRLPTLDELRLIYKNIGQGADNKGEFANELYWSATPFDDYQARLLRFSDGNTSYHYNSSGTFRKFRVRAIRDFKR